MPDEDARLTDFLSDDGSDGEHDADADERDDEDDKADDEADVQDARGDDGDSDRDTPNCETANDNPDTADGGPTEIAPAVPTAVCRPDGAACDACGSIVQRRWREGSGLVCSDCVEW